MVQFSINHPSPLFVIFTYPRTGSTLLSKALSCHSQIKFAEELLNPKQNPMDFKNYRIMDGSLVVSKHYEQSDELASYVKEVFETINGFKIAYDQIHPKSPVTNVLKNIRDLKIIFMRRSYIDAVISYWMALNSHIWQREKNDSIIEDQPSAIPIDFVKKFSHEACSNSLYYHKLFETNKTIDIEYNDLIVSWDSTIKRIQEFLGIDVQKLPMLLEKRITTPLNQLVLNYNQIVSSIIKFL